MTQIIVLIIIVVIYIIRYIISKTTEGVSDISSNIKNLKDKKNERNKKYGWREVDYSKSLFDRNIDIINEFAKKIETYHTSFAIKNSTLDCIKEISLAENKLSTHPGNTYLVDTWKKTASDEWKELAEQIELYFSQQYSRLKEEKIRFNQEKSEFEEILKNKKSPNAFIAIEKYKKTRDIYITDIDKTLIPNNDYKSRENKEKELIENNFILEPFKKLKYSVFSSTEVRNINLKINKFNKEIISEAVKHKENWLFFKKLRDGFDAKNKDLLLQRIDYIINDINLPYSFPKQWEADYDPEESILIVDISLPDVVNSPIFKKVELKTKIVDRVISNKEAKEYIPKIHPAIILRVAFEIFRNDKNKVINLLAINGRVEYDDPATGNKTKTYTSSLVCNREQILALNLSKLDPLAAFLNLKGKTSGTIIDIIPITPTLTLNREDRRFIDTREVLETLWKETNLAAMDRQDFESLIAELFQKEFAEKGAEVKVTQSSRDRWVDAIIFDPDPIKGGKFVVQAKRYTNTVGVSAVRDLCAVVKKEGASRGILVTTSSYWSDAYAFVQNEPVTLLNGSELLGLLEKHGYNFRINISEARKLLKEMEMNS